MLCTNVGTAKGYVKKDESESKKLSRESNKFMKIPKNEFKEQMKSYLKSRLVSKLGKKSEKSDESFLANPINFVLSMLRSDSTKHKFEKELPDVQYDEDEMPTPTDPEVDDKFTFENIVLRYNNRLNKTTNINGNMSQSMNNTQYNHVTPKKKDY